MKFVAATILTALIAFLMCLYMPWWTIAIAGFIVSALVQQKPAKSWLAGFLGVGLLWTLIAIILNAGNDGILAKKIADLFYLNGSSFLLIVITGFIGALVGGMGALAGSFLPKKRH